MRERTLLVPVDYYHYSPHPVIIGIRRAVITHDAGELDALARVMEDSPGWQTLAVAEQAPVGWTKRNALRVRQSIAGAVAPNVPHDYWNPA